MARDETGLGIRQATCRDFLDILWDSADLGELELEPDRALGEIRDAMRQGRISEARDRIEEQLGIVGPVVTYARYLSPRERAEQPLIERIHEYACELSTLAGKLELDARQWSPARQHLLRAIVASPDNGLPRAHLVELYMETGEYRAARELLAAISTGRGFCPELELGLSGPAVEAARNAMRFAVRDAGFLGLLSQVLAQAGQLDDAAKAAQVALEEDPDQPDALKTLAQLESAGGRGEER